MDLFIEKAYDNFLQLLVIALAAVIVLVCMSLRARVVGWLKKHVVVDALRNDSKIRELLVEIRIKTVADRVSVFLFHNGERYVNGNSILRLSGAYESLAAGISSHRESSQNILVSTVPEAVDFLCLENPCDKVFSQKVQQLEGCYYKAVLESQGIQALSKYPLCKGSDIIGFICVDFVRSQGATVAELEIIKKVAPQIELHLNSAGRRLQGWLLRFIGGG